MSGPGPSTQAARASRASRRASGEASRRTETSESAPAPKRQKRTDDQEERDQWYPNIEDEDDSEHDEDGNEKHPVYHWQIWSRLLRVGSQGGLVRYVNQQPASGSDPLDITAVYAPQMHWHLENRSFWPPILKLWKRPDPWNNPTYEVGVMRYKGHVVLDYKGTPIRNFRIPLTVSSAVEGLRIEAWMRADNRLTLGDIMARMWTKDVPGGGKEPNTKRRNPSKRASLARRHAGLISWARRRGRDRFTNFIDDLRSSDQKARNLAIDRDLTSGEIAVLEHMGLDEDKQSNAPTRPERIRKIMAAVTRAGTAAGSTSGVANAGPTNPIPAATSTVDDTANVDTVDEEAVSETEAEDQASGDDTDDGASVSSSVDDPSDSRNDEPQNPQERALLQRALEITVDDFIALMGEQPAPTNPEDNYFSQWAMLQEQFTSLWLDRGNLDEAPRLKARGRWTTGISAFEFAEIIEDRWGNGDG